MVSDLIKQSQGEKLVDSGERRYFIHCAQCVLRPKGGLRRALSTVLNVAI